MKTKNMKSVSTIIAVTIAFSILVAFSATASATTYTVCSSGCDFTTIQGAIDAASDDDIINVHEGTYSENVVVDRELTIKAASSPILDGQGTLTNPAIHITSANVTVQGFIIQNYICTGTGTGGAGDIGAILVEGDGARVNNNVVWNITCTGAFPPCPCGLGIDVHADDVEITNNQVYNISSIGIRVRHDWTTPPTTSNNVLIENNTVYWTGNSGVLITGYAKGVTIKGNEIYESLGPTYYGLLLCMNPSYVIIEDNYIHDSYANIVIAGANHITISGNTITDAQSVPYPGKNIYILNDYNAWTGSVDTLSTDIDITNNDIRNGAFGVRIRNIGATDPAPMASTTTINCNNIVNNTVYGVENTIATDVDATQNWWGHTSGPYDPSNDTVTGGLYNPLGQGDNVSDYVDYDPWSFTPDPCEPKTIGFWKNHEDSVEAILNESGSIYLGNTSTGYYYEVDDFGNATAVFKNATNKNALNMLAAQLLAAELNVAHLTHLGITDYCECIDEVIDNADEFLSDNEYTGPDGTAQVKGKDKRPANVIKDDLDEYNQGLCIC